MNNESLFKQYVNKTVAKEAKVGYDKSVKQWYGILHHWSGLIYAQQEKKSEVKKELAEVLDEFITLYLERNKAKFLEIKTPKAQRAYR